MKLRLGKLLLVPMFLISFSAGAVHQLQLLPVQDHGRLKPYDTFARESLQLLTGKSTYQGQPAWEIVLTWILHPQAWLDRQIIEVRDADLKNALKLEVKRVNFTPGEVFENPRMSLVMQELASFRQTGEKLDPYYQSVQRLEGQYMTFNQIVGGQLLKIVPEKDSQNWVSLDRVTQEYRDAFVGITRAFLVRIAAKTREKVDAQELAAANTEFDESVTRFQDLIREKHEDVYPADSLMRWEAHFNQFHPFRWAWICYLIGALALALAAGGVSGIQFLGYAATMAGFGLHVYGFALRVFLSGRPPVSNMYETVIWVPFGVVLFASIIWFKYRTNTLLIVANILAVLCMIVADMAPAILDPSIQPLEPVLRSSFWLITHVMVIVISYSAFLLACGIGLVGLYFFIRDEKANRARITHLSQLIYRNLQFGVVLLATGIILGGVWADYSWGRFWGWDPKETWALIALLGYIAMLHAKVSGWIRDFGMMVASIVAFSLVIMAWYGVNYVLGAGLHSYGFGAGGVEIVCGVIFIVLSYVAFAVTVRQGRIGKKMAGSPAEKVSKST